jgi:hypothetical protein
MMKIMEATMVVGTVSEMVVIMKTMEDVMVTDAASGVNMGVGEAPCRHHHRLHCFHHHHHLQDRTRDCFHCFYHLLHHRARERGCDYSRTAT